MEEKQKIAVVGIMVDERARNAIQVQEIISRYGDSILARHGIPDPSRRRGVITLTMQAEPEKIAALTGELSQVPGVVAQYAELGPAL